MSYQIQWQSGRTGFTEPAPAIPGKADIVLQNQVIDGTTLDLTLTGKGSPNYGEIQQENYIRLMENFASKVAPVAPTIGQVWFDAVANKLKVYDSGS